jgi:hypothetical protein
MRCACGGPRFDPRRDEYVWVIDFDGALPKIHPTVTNRYWDSGNCDDCWRQVTTWGDETMKRIHRTTAIAACEVFFMMAVFGRGYC